MNLEPTQDAESTKNLGRAMSSPVSPVGVRPWGRWQVVHEGEGFKVKLLEILPGHRLSLQYHKQRSETWTVVAGRANAVVDGQPMELRPTQTASIPAGSVHRLGNPGAEPVLIVEVQHGRVLDEDDIVRLEDDYQRAPKTSLR